MQFRVEKKIDLKYGSLKPKFYEQICGRNFIVDGITTVNGFNTNGGDAETSENTYIAGRQADLNPRHIYKSTYLKNS